MSNLQTSIPCMVLRGGTSRGVYFLADNLPSDTGHRDAVLLSVMGGPDELQIDGIGGGHPLSNKVAIIARSQRQDADIDYLFLQVMPGEARVVDVQNCGNILAGVGPFAIETGMISATQDCTIVRVHMVNSGGSAELLVQTPAGQVCYDGDSTIDGVPGTSAAIVCNFLDVAGSACGALLPTGNTLDEIDGIPVTCVDNGMPVVVMRSSDFGIAGDAAPGDLDQDHALKKRLEGIRLKAGLLMQLGDVSAKTVPKICLVSGPREGGIVATRTFIPHTCHRSIGVLGAVTVATACVLPGSVIEGLAVVPDGAEKTVAVEHPSGSLEVRLVLADGNVGKAGVIRTARLIMKSNVFVPVDVWDGNQQ